MVDQDSLNRGDEDAEKYETSELFLDSLEPTLLKEKTEV